MFSGCCTRLPELIPSPSVTHTDTIQHFCTFNNLTTSPRCAGTILQLSLHGVSYVRVYFEKMTKVRSEPFLFSNLFFSIYSLVQTRVTGGLEPIPAVTGCTPDRLPQGSERPEPDGDAVCRASCCEAAVLSCLVLCFFLTCKI